MENEARVAVVSGVNTLPLMRSMASDQLVSSASGDAWQLNNSALQALEAPVATFACAKTSFLLRRGSRKCKTLKARPACFATPELQLTI